MKRRSGGRADAKRYKNGEGRRHSPTAALLLLVQKIKKAVKMMLSAQTTMLATLPTEPSAPTRRMPHWGLTPTGAVVAFADAFARSDAFVWTICRENQARVRAGRDGWTGLTVEEIAPGIGRDGVAEGLKVAELGHGAAGTLSTGWRGGGIAASAEGGSRGGVVVDKVVLDFGGVRNSELGPPPTAINR